MSDTTERIRVLVVDDSASQRGWLMALLENDPQLEIAGWAAEGAAAVRATARLRPDVITMDLHMPGMDGLEATRQIMHATPTPIVLVTADASRDQRLVTEALNAGVLAVEVKPTGQSESARELLETVKGMARIRVLRRTAPAVPVVPVRSLNLPRRRLELVAIGASTGGPQALHELLTRLPESFPLSVVVVQHMSAGFVPSLVDWLAPQCALPVHVAVAGRSLDIPSIHIAPTGQHLVIQHGRLQLTYAPPVGSHRPSVTTLFSSVAREYGGAAIGVLLSGMGDDGAYGLRDLKQAGAVTVAQDAATCVVFGMPAAAIRLGVVDYTLPPAQIGSLLDRLTRRSQTA
jgi:two-component system chemotaxis response regulator CheB